MAQPRRARGGGGGGGGIRNSPSSARIHAHGHGHGHGHARRTIGVAQPAKKAPAPRMALRDVHGEDNDVRLTPADAFEYEGPGWSVRATMPLDMEDVLEEEEGEVPTDTKGKKRASLDRIDGRLLTTGSLSAASTPALSLSPTSPSEEWEQSSADTHLDECGSPHRRTSMDVGTSRSRESSASSSTTPNSSRSSSLRRMPSLLQQGVSPPTVSSHVAAIAARPATISAAQGRTLIDVVSGIGSGSGKISTSTGTTGRQSAALPSLYYVSRGRSAHVSPSRRWDRRGASASVLCSSHSQDEGGAAVPAPEDCHCPVSSGIDAPAQSSPAPPRTTSHKASPEGDKAKPPADPLRRPSLCTVADGKVDPLQGASFGCVDDAIKVDAVVWADERRQSSPGAIEQKQIEGTTDSEAASLVSDTSSSTSRRKTVAEQEDERRTGFAAAYQQRLSALSMRLWSPSKSTKTDQEESLEPAEGAHVTSAGSGVVEAVEPHTASSLLASGWRHLTGLPNLLMPHSSVKRGRGVLTPQEADRDISAYVSGLGLPIDPDVELSSVVHLQAFRVDRARRRREQESSSTTKPQEEQQPSDLHIIERQKAQVTPEAPVSKALKEEGARGKVELPHTFSNDSQPFQARAHGRRRSHADDSTVSSGPRCSRPAVEAPVPGNYSAYNSEEYNSEEEESDSSCGEVDRESAREADERDSRGRGSRRASRRPSPPPSQKQCAVGLFSSSTSTRAHRGAQPSSRNSGGGSLRSSRQASPEADSRARVTRIRSTPNLQLMDVSVQLERTAHKQRSGVDSDDGVFHDGDSDMDEERSSRWNGERTRGRADAVKRVSASHGGSGVSRKSRNTASGRSTSLGSSPFPTSIMAGSAAAAAAASATSNGAPAVGQPGTSGIGGSSLGASGLRLPPIVGAAGMPCFAGRPSIVSNGAHLLMLSLELEMMRSSKITGSLKPRWLKARMRTEPYGPAATIAMVARERQQQQQQQQQQVAAASGDGQIGSGVVSSEDSAMSEEDKASISCQPRSPVHRASVTTRPKRGSSLRFELGADSSSTSINERDTDVDVDRDMSTGVAEAENHSPAPFLAAIAAL